MMNEQNVLLDLIKLGLEKKTIYKMPKDIDWQAVFDLAERQMVTAIALDGINRLFEKGNELDIDLQTKYEWIGVAQQVEALYLQHEANIHQLVQFYQKHGIKMMVLKGYGLSLNYPVPNHRAPGDIDIYLFGDYERGDKLMESELGIEIDRSHHHHTVFSFQGEMVENHYDFLNVHYGHRNNEIEALLKEQAKDDSYSIEIEGQRVYCPNANLHALFVIRHTMHNFAATEMTLRQVLDWAFLVEKHTKEIDWKWLLGILKEYKMMDFFNIINAICVDDLDFSAVIFPSVQFLPSLKERVLADIFSPEFAGETPNNIFKRAVFKYHRWQANAWKQDICYGDNRYKSFIEGVWSHLLKPASI